MPARTATAAKAEPKPRAAKATLPEDPLSTVSHFINGGLAQGLGTEHQRQLRLVIGDGVDATNAAKQTAAIAAIAAVTDADSYARVGTMLVDVARRRKEIELFFKPIKDLANKLHKAICSRENEVLQPVRLFEEIAGRNTLAWSRAEEQKRRDEEQRLSLQAQHEEQERLQREAEQLADRGETQLAEQVMEQAIATPAPVMTVASNLPEVKGLSFRENWTWRPIGGDTAEGRARAEKLVPREFLCLDEKKLNAYAKAHKASARIPGLEFYDAGSPNVRT